MAAASSESETGSVLQGEYVLLDKLGEHAGAVYRAKRRRDAATVTVRLWQAHTLEAANAFLERARAAARVRHPMLAAVEACGRERDTLCFVVSEYVAGPTLADWADRVGIPPFANIIDLGHRLCVGLQVAQRHGVFHDALRPNNVLVAPHTQSAGQRPAAKLLDVGVPAFLRPPAPRVAALQFMAPEQLAALLTSGPQAWPSADPAMNVYSLGCLLYSLCTGGAPYPSTRADELRQAHGEGKLTPPARINPQVPPALNAVIVRALSIAPAERFASAAALGEALAQIDLSTSSSGVRLVVPLPAGVQPTPAPPARELRSRDDVAAVPTTRPPPRPRSETPLIDVTAFDALLARDAAERAAERALGTPLSDQAPPVPRSSLAPPPLGLRASPASPLRAATVSEAAPRVAPSVATTIATATTERPSKRGRSGALAWGLVLSCGAAALLAFFRFQSQVRDEIVTTQLTAPAAGSGVAEFSASAGAVQPSATQVPAAPTPQLSATPAAASGITPQASAHPARSAPQLEDVPQVGTSAPTPQPRARSKAVDRNRAAHAEASTRAPAQARTAQPVVSVVRAEDPDPQLAEASAPGAAASARGTAERAPRIAAQVEPAALVAAPLPAAPAEPAARATTSQPAAPADVAREQSPARPEPSAAPKLRASAGIVDVQVRGSLPSSLVRRAVLRTRAALASCYARAAQAAGRDGFGELRVQVEIDERGRARDAQATGGALPGLDRCVAGAVSKVVSERAPDTGTVKAAWKVTFAP